MTARPTHGRRLAHLITALPAAGALALASSTAPAAAATRNPPPLISGGGFETPRVPTRTFVRYGTGSGMGAWKVTAGDVDLIGAGFWQAAEGRQSLDLEGGVAGTIERSFDTAIGVCYAVDYAVAGNVDGPPATKTGYARVTQGLLSLPLRPLRRDFSFDTTGRTRADMGYVRKSLHFRSLASKATLTFAGTTGSGYGPVIDDVSVSATLLSHCHRS